MLTEDFAQAIAEAVTVGDFDRVLRLARVQLCDALPTTMGALSAADTQLRTPTVPSPDPIKRANVHRLQVANRLMDLVEAQGHLHLAVHAIVTVNDTRKGHAYQSSATPGPAEVEAAARMMTRSFGLVGAPQQCWDGLARDFERLGAMIRSLVVALSGDDKALVLMAPAADEATRETAFSFAVASAVFEMVASAARA